MLTRLGQLLTGIRQWITDSLAHMMVAAAAALLAVVVIAGGAVAWTQQSGRCAPGVQRRGPRHECTGVTGGGYLYGPRLAAVEKAIARENAAVAGRHHATIALLMPLTAADPAVQAEIMHAVQGAYVAQYRANHRQNDQIPPVRLVLANPGVDSAQWRPVVRQLARLTGEPDNLRAAVGISVSTDTTKKEVGWLTAHGIPVVGGAITADDITNPPGNANRYPGLARVSPTNDEEAPALAHFSAVDTKRALLVEDTRTNDDYITTLAHAFAAHLAGSPQQPEHFTQGPDAPNQFVQMVQNICESHVKWIYFAGRQMQLRQFINALGKRGCQDEKFTILTGSAASHLGTDRHLDESAFGTGITLDYAAIAHPGAWAGRHLPATGGSRQDYADFAATLRSAQRAPIGPIGPIGSDPLTDGQSIITYDAVWTAVTAIRGATSGTTQVPGLHAITNEWQILHDVHKVHGASGWICLDNGGNPYDKAVPIVQYRTSNHPTFVTLAWPTGSPPPATCTAPFTR